MTIKMVGLSRMIKGLTDMHMKCDSEIGKVVKANTSELQQKEMRTVPVDTGFLKRSITLTMKDNGLTGVVEPTATYATFVEFGTRFMAAQPYVRPNYDAQAKQFIKDMQKFVK